LLGIILRKNVSFPPNLFGENILRTITLVPGWNGKHCTLEGCPGNCNNHGQCKTNQNMEWECWCESGWFGAGCDIHLEQDCSDRKDNDEGFILFYVINFILFSNLQNTINFILFSNLQNTIKSRLHFHTWTSALISKCRVQLLL
jgi:hypothetical protein